MLVKKARYSRTKVYCAVLFVVQDEAVCITKRKYIYVCNESLKIRKTKGGSYAKEQKRR